ncbi:MAG: hypothetical protein AAB888_00620 [Patescibacteria group bacterium]
MKKENNVVPEERVFFTSTPPVRHSYGMTIEVCAVRKTPKGLIDKGSIIFGHANGVLLSLKVSPPPAKGRFFSGIFDEMIKIAEEVVLRTSGERPQFSIKDCKTF